MSSSSSPSLVKPLSEQEDVVLSQPIDTVVGSTDKIPCTTEPSCCALCPHKRPHKHCNCCKPVDCCSYTKCGEGCGCTNNSSDCKYKYDCGEGQCMFASKSYCNEDTRCVTNHEHFLECMRNVHLNWCQWSSWKTQHDDAVEVK